MASGPPAFARPRLIGIFVSALVILSYQVLLTRIFSVVLYYHYAFAGITLAMLGMTIGAEQVHRHPKKFSADRLQVEWARAALGFSVSSVVLVLSFLYCPLIVPEGAARIILSLSLMWFLVPYVYGGICTTSILTRSGASVGTLYAADLVGAACGCVGIVGALFVVDPVSITFALASLSAFAAWLMVRSVGSFLTTLAGWLAGIFLIACVAQAGLYLTGRDHLGVTWAKEKLQRGSLFERWNAFSRVRVVPYAHREPFGWGYGREVTGQIDQNYLDIDGGAGTIITRFDGDFGKLDFLAEDVVNVAFQLRPTDEVAVVGVGGGRDILSALNFRTKHVTGIEFNPAILAALTGPFADFSGRLTDRRDVTLVSAEARSWLAQSGKSFDLIQISGIDTWAATAAGGLTLTENGLYTVEAWRDFLHALTRRGMLAVSRWFVPGKHEGELCRLLSLAAEALRENGTPSSEIAQHILAIGAGQIVTVVTSAAPFSPDEQRTLAAVAARHRFSVLISPDFAWNETGRVIASGLADAAFYDSLPLNVAPTTDDRPFFFYTSRPGSLFREDAAGYNLALATVALLLVGTLLCTLVFVLLPLFALPQRTSVRAMVPELGYFMGIGLGFMLIEISQMQRLMIFLGHPVYGLSVVLFTLLLFGGIGSATVRATPGAARLWIRPLLLCFVLAAIGTATPWLTGHLRSHGAWIRVPVSAALLAPAGFCMGMMFPIGMLFSARHPEQQPWFWGVNGAASVLGSVLGMAISVEFGIAAAYWTGTACYGLCALLIASFRGSPVPAVAMEWPVSPARTASNV